MPSAYLKSRLRSLDEALGELGLSRTDVGLPPVPSTRTSRCRRLSAGVSRRTLFLACGACLMLGAAIGGRHGGLGF